MKMQRRTAAFCMAALLAGAALIGVLESTGVLPWVAARVSTGIYVSATSIPGGGSASSAWNTGLSSVIILRIIGTGRGGRRLFPSCPRLSPSL